MQSKVILATLSAVIFTCSAVFGLNCPSIPEQWDGKTLEASGPLTWSVGKMKLNEGVNLADVNWQAYHAWILPENKPQFLKYGYFQCNYKAVDKKEPGKSVGKMTISSPQTEELKKLAADHQFQGGSGGAVVNDYKSGVKQGAKCTPDVGSPEGLNKFPSACEIVERPKKQ